MGVVDTNLSTDPSGFRVSGCALEEGVTVGSKLVLLLSAMFVYCTTFKTFFQPFQAGNGTKESCLKLSMQERWKTLSLFYDKKMSRKFT